MDEARATDAAATGIAPVGSGAGDGAGNGTADNGACGAAGAPADAPTGQGATAAPPKARRPRARAKPKRVRWSKKARAAFLRSLGEAACVREACRVSGLADSTVYRRRRTEPGFLAEWNEALAEGVARLEAELLDRALNGVEKAVWHGGKKVGSVRHYNDGLALALLRAHGPTVGRAAAPVPAVPAPPPATAHDIDRLRADTKAWLSEMNRRMGGAG